MGGLQPLLDVQDLQIMLQMAAAMSWLLGTRPESAVSTTPDHEWQPERGDQQAAREPQARGEGSKVTISHVAAIESQKNEPQAWNQPTGQQIALQQRDSLLWDGCLTRHCFSNRSTRSGPPRSAFESQCAPCEPELKVGRLTEKCRRRQVWAWRVLRPR